MREAMQHAGLCIDDIAKLQRDPAQYLGFIEVHIEQGPVLNELDLPLGVVTSINGSVRYLCEMIGTASHAGTTPMDRRRDAAVAVAELALYMEQRAAKDGDSVGTIGLLNVPSGSINVVPGRCLFSLDLRAPTDAQRDALVTDVLDELAKIAQRRGLRYTLEESMRAAAAPSAPALAAPLGARRGRPGRARVPHAQRRGARRDEAARNHAAGHAVHARRKLRHQPQPARIHHQQRHATGRGRLHPGAAPACRGNPAMTTPTPASYTALDAWIDQHFDEEVRFLQALVRVPTDTPPGNNAPHAERTAELLKDFGFDAEKHAVPAADVQAYGMESITNLIVRRPYGHRRQDHCPERPRRRGAARRRLDARPLRRRDCGRQDVRPRHRREQERLCQLHLCRARARSRGPAHTQGAVELHFTYDEEFGGELGPGWLLQKGLTKPDLMIAAGFSYEVVTAHNGCLQMEVTVHGKMAHAAVPHTGVDALQGAVHILNALYAQNDEYKKVTSKIEGISTPTSTWAASRAAPTPTWCPAR
jgi:acetylornithine deacetylase/succinyl-diaminopimelate desuccinylase-like protein